MPTYIMFWKEIDINIKYILMPTMLLIVCPRFILLFLLTSLLSFFSFLVTVIFHKIKTLINKVSMLPYHNSNVDPVYQARDSSVGRAEDCSMKA